MTDAHRIEYFVQMLSIPTVAQSRIRVLSRNCHTASWTRSSLEFDSMQLIGEHDDSHRCPSAPTLSVSLLFPVKFMKLITQMLSPKKWTNTYRPRRLHSCGCLIPEHVRFLFTRLLLSHTIYLLWNECISNTGAISSLPS
jgi:hypothetical protein